MLVYLKAFQLVEVYKKQKQRRLPYTMYLCKINKKKEVKLSANKGNVLTDLFQKNYLMKLPTDIKYKFLVNE